MEPPITTQASSSSSFPTSVSELTFTNSAGNEVNSSIYKTLTALRKTTLSIQNRLRSISEDAEFIESYFRNHNSEYATYPIIANERCGSWYIAPHLKGGSAYFKSTDGHHGQWAFSLRRLNLTLLEMLGDNGGAILVDSTRRGKRLPDALRRTVPIWVAVWNRVLFRGGLDESESRCETCPRLDKFQSCGLERAEVRQIEPRLDEWVNDLKGLGLDINTLRSKVKHPIRCVWVVHGEGESLPDDWTDACPQHNANKGMTWNTLVLCSASRRVVGAEMSEDGYIQGAGDDSEGWSCGLTPTLFWRHKDLLHDTTEHDLPELIKTLVMEDHDLIRTIEVVPILPTKHFFIAAGTVSSTESSGHQYDLIICCNGSQADVENNMLDLSCREGKLGSRDLREKLSLVRSAAEQILRRNSGAKVVVACNTGRDHSVGVLIALLCLYCDDAGCLDLQRAQQPVNKQMIKQRLAWITSCKPDANPSRSTLQAVNSFLIDRPS